MKKLLLSAIMLTGLGASAQLVIDNATFFIGEGAVVTVEGNVQSNVSIQAGGAGATLGKLQMKGSVAQTLNMGGATNRIPRLEIDNAAHVQLTSAARVVNLEFTAGKLQLGNFDLVHVGTVTGAAAGRFVETNGTGFFRDSVATGALVNAVLPVGNGNDYTPITIVSSANNTGANATVGVRSTGMAVATPTRHPRTEAYLSTEWTYETQNLANAGTLTGTGTYVPGDVVLAPSTNLTATDITGFSRVGSTWSLAGTTKAANSVGATLPGTGGSLYGMNTFILASPTAFLQGANNNDGTMKDTYRTPVLILPNSDPYRSAPYLAAFPHLGNPVTETVVGTPFADQPNANNNIVDWVFLELRGVTGATTAPVLQTRSALITRNGSIVDIDGVSPIYFKNVNAGTNYSIAVRHRNHLGLSTNPAMPLALGLVANAVNLRTSDAGSLFGTANVNYVNAGGNNMLYAGNAFINTTINYIGLGSTDRAQLLTVMANPSNALTPARAINTVSDYQAFSVGDLNFNRSVDYIGLGTPDRGFLVSQPLGGVLNPSPAKTQVLPN